jgi:uncharacterized protein involved in tolerance to divalent cations
MSFDINGLVKALDPATAREALESCTVTWEPVTKCIGASYERTATAKTRETLEAGIKQALARIDPYRSPGVAFGPRQLDDGRWSATIQWFALGD